MTMGTLNTNESRENECIRVVVRCRPMNVKEISAGYCDVINVLPSMNAIKICNPKQDDDTEGKIFTFDAVYGSESTQEDLYKESVLPIINAVLDGFNGTILAYGQTGTGKTFTMLGNQTDPSKRGVVPQSFHQIFNHISESKHTQYLIRSSYIEIYQEEVKDLLDEDGNKTHELRGYGPDVFIKNIKSHVCRSAKEMEKVMQRGNKNRKIGKTNMNEYSSRSHAIFIITVEMSKIVCGINQVRVGKLNFVDLAGSERQSKTCVTGEHLKEASKINLSLSALGNVISALSNGKNFHIPYRDSKLTRLLQDSLGGSSKTLMIANIGPASYNYEESLTTLRYANRAKNIKNKPKINEDPKDTLIREYQDEIIRLKALVQSKLATKKNNLLITKNKNETEEQNTSTHSSDLICESLRQQPCETHIYENTPEMIKEKKEKFLEEKRYTEELKTKINILESKLLNSKNITDHTNEQQKILQQRAEEIREKEIQKTKLAQLLEQEEETTEELQETNLNLEQEVERKNKKLRKILSTLNIIKKQTTDIIEEFNVDRRDLEEAQNDLIKQCKLNQIIIENFIPKTERQKITFKFYDEENEIWNTNYTKKSVQRVSAKPHQRRPEAEYTRIMSKLNCMPRYKSENIIRLSLDKLKRMTKDYKSPKISPTIKYAMEKALEAEDDVIVDATHLKKYNYSRWRPSSISKILFQNNINSNNNKITKKNYYEPIYPKVRGLIKK